MAKSVDIQRKDPYGSDDEDRAPKGYEDSGGHWETDDDGSRNFYIPPGNTSIDLPENPSLMSSLPNGGNVVIDDDGLATPVERQPREQRGERPDPTDTANDYLDRKNDRTAFKHYLAANPEQVPNLHGPAEMQPGRVAPPTYADRIAAALRGQQMRRSASLPYHQDPYAPSDQEIVQAFPGGGKNPMPEGERVPSYEDHLRDSLSKAGIAGSSIEDLQSVSRALKDRAEERKKLEKVAEQHPGGVAHLLFNAGVPGAEGEGDEDTETANHHHVEPDAAKVKADVERAAVEKRQALGAQLEAKRLAQEKKWKEEAAAKAEAVKKDEAVRSAETKARADAAKAQGTVTAAASEAGEKDLLGKKKNSWIDAAKKAIEWESGAFSPLRLQHVSPGGMDGQSTNERKLERLDPQAGDEEQQAAHGNALGAPMIQSQSQQSAGTVTEAEQNRLRSALIDKYNRGEISGGTYTQAMANLPKVDTMEVGKLNITRPNADPYAAQRASQIKTGSPTDPNYLLNAQKADQGAASTETPEENAETLKAEGQKSAAAEQDRAAGADAIKDSYREDASPTQTLPEYTPNDLITGTGSGGGAAQASGAGGARLVNVPAQKIPTADPADVAQLQRDVIAQGEPAQQEGNANSAAAQAEAEILRRKGELEEQQARDQQQQEEVRKQKMDRFMDDLRTQADDIAQQKIDPSRLWHNKDAGAKAMTTLALIAGGMLMGLKGLSSNPAMDQINKEIDRDVDAQKADMGHRKQRLDSMHNQLELYRMQFGDQRMAEAAVRLSRLNGLDAFAASEQAKYKDPAFQARVAAIRAQLKVEADKIGLAANHYVAAHQVLVGGPGEVTDKDVGEKFVPELGGIARSKDEAHELRHEVLPAYNDAAHWLAKARALRRANAQLTPSGALELRQAIAHSVVAINQINKLTRLSDKDIELNKEMAGSLDTAVIGSEGSDRALEAAQRDLPRQMSNQVKNYGLLGATMDYHPVTGQPVYYYNRRQVTGAQSNVPQGTDFASAGR